MRVNAVSLQWGKLYNSQPWGGVTALLKPAAVQNHAPQLAWINPRTLGLTWMAGDAEGSAGMSIYFASLRHGAKRWSRPRRLSQDNQRSEQNPLLFSAGGHLHLIHTAQICRDSTTHENVSGPYSMQWTAMLRLQTQRSSRLGWNRAVDLIREPAFCRNPPYQRADGYFLLPIYRSLKEGTCFGADHSQVLLLEPDGHTICGDPIDVPKSKGRVHGSIVPSRDGKQLLQFFRSRLADRIYVSKGSLDGLCWTEPVATSLPNNNSSIQARRLHSGRLCIIFNRCSIESAPVDNERWGDSQWPKARAPMSVALSEDDGLTWPWVKDIDSGSGYCSAANNDKNVQLAYPTIVEDGPGALHIAYSWWDRLAIRYLLLSEDEILGEASPW